MITLEQKAWNLYCKDLGGIGVDQWDALAKVTQAAYLQRAAAEDTPLLQWQRYDLPRDSRLTYVLRQILYDLPEKRDWLNPELERIARELVK